jgi:hypothetical protein
MNQRTPLEVVREVHHDVEAVEPMIFLFLQLVNPQNSSLLVYLEHDEEVVILEQHADADVVLQEVDEQRGIG